ncbi:response regulator transcription factor [Prolixibacter sp. SD074]|jgi:DNA-binding response OmpR family regulator|uniref:response regulator transcription factor n=1 Tax=Prolixibacter sp. SD074 TaxID=2652391 RepID=UPI0012817D4A|nr:response regulator transcription factor [Prolixibacter sp. SD074]GET28948.1 DNA-binding response regulator [Prolixibacter sp. SD074]
MKILIIEDERSLADDLVNYLAAEGNVCESAHNYFAAEDKLAAFHYDIILLDINLPDGNGLQLLHLLREQEPPTGVLIISARDSLDDKLKGLGLGADDYLTKPFHLAEVNARVKALSRRRIFGGKAEIRYHEISIDPESGTVRVNEQVSELTRKEFALLQYFVTNKNRVMTKEAIAEHLWGDYMEMAGNFDFIYTHIKNLRRKLTDAGANDYIRTVYGMGYKWSDE